MREEKKNIKKHIKYICLRVFIIMVAVYFIAVRFELFESLIEILVKHENNEIDEIIVAVLVGSIAIFFELIVLSLLLNKESMLYEYLSIIDPLTGTMNRRGFFNESIIKLKNMELQDGKMSVYYIDIDGFKSINDRYGHSVGDSILIEVANTLTLTAPSNTIVGRIGGDEFIVLIDDSTIDYESMLQKALTKANGNRVNDIYVSVSIGKASYPNDGVDIDSLVLVADKNMYKNKEIKSMKHVESEELRKSTR